MKSIGVLNSVTTLMIILMSLLIIPFKVIGKKYIKLIPSTRNVVMVKKPQLRKVRKGKKDIVIEVKKTSTIYEIIGSSKTSTKTETRASNAEGELNITSNILNALRNEKKILKIYPTGTTDTTFIQLCSCESSGKYSSCFCSATTDKFDCAKTEIPTAIFTLDMCLPCSKAMTSNICKRNRLTMRNNELAAFRIINNNSHRYEVSIDGEEVSFHTDSDFDLKAGKAGNPTTKIDDAIAAKPKEEVIQTLGLKNLELEAEVKSLAEKKATIEKHNVTPDPNLDTEFVESVKIILELDIRKSAIRSIDSLESELEAFSSNYKSENCLENARNYDKHRKRLIVAYQKISAWTGSSEKMPTTIDNFFESSFRIVEGFKSTDIKNKMTEFLSEMKKELEDKIYKTHESKSKLKRIEEQLIELNSIVTESYTLPRQVLGRNLDLISFKVSRKDKLTKKTESYTYDIWIRNGFKIDMSAGLFLSSLRNFTYSTKNNPDTSQGKIIFRRDEGWFTFAFGTLLNATWRFNEVINPGVNFGLGFTTETDYQLLAGGTIIIGKRSRVGINGGFTWGKVTRLDGAYELGESYDLEGGSPPTVEKFEQGCYFGITYNLFKPATQSKS